MLFRLEIENFASIRDPQVVDLLAGKSAGAESGRLVPIGPGAKERAPRVIALFGPNASGKSNILRALSFLAWFVRESFGLAPDKHLPFTRFLDNKSQDEPTRLAIWFTGPTDPGQLGESDTQSCKYSYEVMFGGERSKPQQVLFEALKYWPIETNRQVILFQRDSDGSVKGHKTFGLSGYHSALEKVLRSNVSVISTLTQLKHPIATQLWYFASQLVSNILIEKEDYSEDAILRLYRSNPDLLKALNNDIQRIDFGVRDLKLIDSVDGPVALIHHAGLAAPLTLPFESHGTRQFIKTFPLIYEALARGGVAVIDEFDLSIHPLVLPEILRWFYDSKRNPHHAQLWMTGQNPSLLEELIKEEVFFCEKDSAGKTKIYGLRDIQAVRRADNYYRKYLSGVYGAVPRIG